MSPLDAVIARRLAEVEAGLKAAVHDTTVQVVMITLTDLDGPTEADRERWERTCDVCGTYVPHGPGFWTGVTKIPVPEGFTVEVTFGLCTPCKEREEAR